MIHIFYTHRLAEITRRFEESLEVPAPLSVRELVDRLTARYGKAFAEEIDLRSTEIGVDSPFYLVFVDGIRIWEKEREEKKIREGSAVSFLSLMSGG
jgi:molybdopterin converting factor small subunit